MPAITQIAPGLPDPARDSQLLFRRILDATSYVGRIETLNVALSPPAGLSVAAAALVLTLVDGDVELWLSSSLREELTPWVRFHCGCPVLTGDNLDAAFALVAQGDACPPLKTVRIPDPERPDISTSLIIEVEALTGGRPLRATGPGINGDITIAPKGCPEDLWQQRKALRPYLPLGVDLFLTAGTEVMALPRYTLIQEID